MKFPRRVAALSNWFSKGMRYGANALAEHLFPQDCLVCGARAGERGLCGDCGQELPGRSLPRCPVCALPQAQGVVCGACLRRPPAFDASLAALDYGFPVDRLVQSLKYAHRLPVLRLFVEEMADLPRPEADVVVPMPLSKARLAARGFNQAAELARPLARRWGMDLMLDGVVRDVDTPPQASLAWKERGANVRGVFRCPRPLEGLRVVVVDDVMTTGATLSEVARVLKASGAARVENRVIARTPPPA